MAESTAAQAREGYSPGSCPAQRAFAAQVGGDVEADALNLRQMGSLHRGFPYCAEKPGWYRGNLSFRPRRACARRGFFMSGRRRKVLREKSISRTKIIKEV